MDTLDPVGDAEYTESKTLLQSCGFLNLPLGLESSFRLHTFFFTLFFQWLWSTLRWFCSICVKNLEEGSQDG
jgi:hypothetical protein